MLDDATRECVDCGDVALALLKAADAWVEAAALLDAAPGVDRRELAEEARSLVDGGFLVVEGTELAHLEARYEELWEWDVRAGLYHFSIKDADFMTDAERVSDLAARVEGREAVPFYTTNEGFSTVVPLSRPSHDEGVFAILSRRLDDPGVHGQARASTPSATVLRGPRHHGSSTSRCRGWGARRRR